MFKDMPVWMKIYWFIKEAIINCESWGNIYVQRQHNSVEIILQNTTTWISIHVWSFNYLKPIYPFIAPNKKDIGMKFVKPNGPKYSKMGQVKFEESKIF